MPEDLFLRQFKNYFKYYIISVVFALVLHNFKARFKRVEITCITPYYIYTFFSGFILPKFAVAD